MRVAPCPALAWHTSSSRVGILRRTSLLASNVNQTCARFRMAAPRNEIIASECNVLPTFDFVVP
jgi:hypothetical protein